MKRLNRLLRVVPVAMALTMTSHAQPIGATASATDRGATELRVGAILAPPFIMGSDGALTGFSIELWNEIGARLKVTTRYELEPDAAALETAMRSHRLDLSVAPIFITAARDEEFDFSYPILEAGVQVMVRDGQGNAAPDNPFRDMLRLLLSRTTLMWLGMAVLLVLIPAHLVWFLERRRDDGLVSGRGYFPGIFQSAFWAISTLTTQAEGMPRQWLARAFAIFWMFAGMVFVASYTAQLTTTLTVEQIRGAINGPDDLPGKRVGTLAHTLAVSYLSEHGARTEEFRTIDQTFQALQEAKVDAVFMPAPLLRYYASHEGKGRARLVGPEINITPAAVMVQLDSPLRKKIDAALLALREDGTYQALYDKWFGGA